MVEAILFPSETEWPQGRSTPEFPDRPVFVFFSCFPAHSEIDFSFGINLANEWFMELPEKILIIDEVGFSNIYSLILESEDYCTETITEVDGLVQRLNENEYGLIMVSYPCRNFPFEEVRRRGIPTVILYGHINSKTIRKLQALGNKLMSGQLIIQRSYILV
jgi:hypothetical protein